LEVSAEGMCSLGYITPEGSLLKARIHLFVAEKCLVKRPYEPGEVGHQSLDWFTLNEALAMAGRSDIQDPSSLVALYRYALRK